MVLFRTIEFSCLAGGPARPRTARRQPGLLPCFSRLCCPGLCFLSYRQRWQSCSWEQKSISPREGANDGWEETPRSWDKQPGHAQETKKQEVPKNGSSGAAGHKASSAGAHALNEGPGLQEGQTEMPIAQLLYGLRVGAEEWLLCLGPSLGLKAVSHGARWPGQPPGARGEEKKESFIPEVCADPWGLGSRTAGSAHSLRGDWGSQAASRHFQGRKRAGDAPLDKWTYLLRATLRDACDFKVSWRTGSPFPHHAKGMPGTTLLLKESPVASWSLRAITRGAARNRNCRVGARGSEAA